MRFDSEDARPIDEKIEKEVIKHIEQLAKKCDIVVLSDYAKGVLTQQVVHSAIRIAHAHGKKVVADFKPIDAKRFVGVDLMAPNLAEARTISGIEDVDKAGAKLVRDFKSNVFVTRGADGISVYDRKGTHQHIPAKKVTVFDVTGAGDTVTATAALALASGADLFEAAKLANAAGQIVVQKAGTAVATLEDILSTLTIHLDSAESVKKVWGEDETKRTNISQTHHSDQDSVKLSLTGQTFIQIERKC